MSDIKWIKITTNIFDDEKIKLIEKLPEGDTMLIVWLKLLIMAGKRNDSGLIYITRDIPFTADLLSDVMNRDSKIVSLALNTFKSFEMIEIFDNFIQITNWEKHQNIEGMERIKQLKNARNKRYNDKKKLLENKTPNKTPNKTTKDVLDKNRIDKKREDKNKYAEYVEMTEKEYNTLLEKYGEKQTAWMIDRLNTYKGSKGTKYKSDYMAMYSWVAKAYDNQFPNKPQEEQEIIYKEHKLDPDF